MLFTIKTNNCPLSKFLPIAVPDEKWMEIKGGEDIIITDMVEG